MEVENVDLAKLFAALKMTSAARVARNGKSGGYEQLMLDTANLHAEFVEILAGAALSIAVDYRRQADIQANRGEDTNQC